MKTMICAAALTAMWAATAHAAAVHEDVHSARFMLPYCKLNARQTMANSHNALIYGQCFGMVSGIVATAEVLRQAQEAGKAELDPVVCIDIPGDTTILQVLEAVVRYGEKHPDQTSDRFETFAFTALRDAWPCKK